MARGTPTIEVARVGLCDRNLARLRIWCLFGWIRPSSRLSLLSLFLSRLFLAMMGEARRSSASSPDAAHSALWNASMDLCHCEAAEWQCLQDGIWTAVNSPYGNKYVDVKLADKKPARFTLPIQEGRRIINLLIWFRSWQGTSQKSKCISPPNIVIIRPRSFRINGLARSVVRRGPWLRGQHGAVQQEECSPLVVQLEPARGAGAWDDVRAVASPSFPGARGRKKLFTSLLLDYGSR
ncbi:uncharacterized protein [Miscanthus floridulus]|uniref:uncharacterized protein isoform X4 n=1 Tax=Miscanthus floridulus TaxID=154761 RepID=UPI00345813FE